MSDKVGDKLLIQGEGWRDYLSCMVALWLPRRLVYWCAAVVMLNATKGKPNPLAVITATEALNAWAQPPKREA